MLVEKLFKPYWKTVRDSYSSLRGTVRCKTDVPGNMTTFAGPSWNVDCRLEEYFSGDWVEEDINLYMNTLGNAESFALVTTLSLNRKATNLIVDSLCYNEHQYATGDQIDIKAICDILQHIPLQDEITGVVGFQQWDRIKKLAALSDKDIENGEPWFGIHWYLNSSLPLINNQRRCFIYHSAAIGFADSGKFKTDITWHGERAQYFANTSLKMGACIINPDLIYEIDVEEGVNEE